MLSSKDELNYTEAVNRRMCPILSKMLTTSVKVDVPGQQEVAESDQHMVRQKLVGRLCSAVDDHCTADVNGTFVQPSEGQQHGMKMMVQAEQLNVCMLKSLLLEMTVQQFSIVFLYQL